MQPNNKTGSKFQTLYDDWAETIHKRMKPDTLSPIEQWDQVAFTLIRNELAPKGFSEIKRGPWRGKVQSNIPFLPKHTVDRCQKGAAQLVRAFRDKVRMELEGRMKDAEVKRDQALKDMDACTFFQFRRKRKFQEVHAYYRDRVDLLMILIMELDRIGIK